MGTTLHILIWVFFHPGWTDLDRDKLNTRHEALVEFSLVEPVIACRETCSVTGGLWLDPYSNQLFTDPRLLDIHHVVPLKEAYRSGGNLWTRRKFAQFANDPDNLLAVSASLNRAKGDREPGAWPSPAIKQQSPYWCGEYVDLYLRIKKKWGLRADARDRC